MAKITNTQLTVLLQAAHHENGTAIAPEKRGAAALRKISEVLIERKLMREVLTKRGMPIWRKAEDGRSISLVILKAGRHVVTAKSAGFHSDPRFLVTNQSDMEAKANLAPAMGLAHPRTGSKLSLVIALLSNDARASLKALAEVTGCLPHTTRASWTGLRKRGFSIERVRAW